MSIENSVSLLLLKKTKNKKKSCYYHKQKLKNEKMKRFLVIICKKTKFMIRENIYKWLKWCKKYVTIFRSINIYFMMIKMNNINEKIYMF